MTKDYSVLWVCVDCYAAANGVLEEQEDYTPDREPLSLIDDWAQGSMFPGLPAEEHSEDCPVWLGDPSRADVPVREAECDCERISFAWAPCDGCGSTLGGSREALTVWDES